MPVVHIKVSSKTHEELCRVAVDVIELGLLLAQLGGHYPRDLMGEVAELGLVRPRLRAGV